jgi:AraC-like DNA-binding protein
MQHQEEHTTLASWALAIERALLRHDVDTKAMFAELGIDYQQLCEPEARLPTRVMWTIWHAALQQTKDDAFGLQVAQGVFPTHLNALVFALQASANIQECIERLIRYSRVVSTIGQIEFEHSGGQIILRLNAPDMAQGPWMPIDAFMALLVKFIRDFLTPEHHALLQTVTLIRPVPDNQQAFDDYFKCELQYGSACNKIVASDALLNLPLPGANSTIAKVNDQLLQDYLQKLDDQSFSLAVRKQIIAGLGKDQLTQEGIASALNMSGRTLQRKLVDEGTSFKELLDSIREELAIRYLSIGDMSISELTFMLGFVDQSSFSRAFKRWTGTTPSKYRKQHTS